jgi:hypothetical protein
MLRTGSFAGRRRRHHRWKLLEALPGAPGPPHGTPVVVVPSRRWRPPAAPRHHRRHRPGGAQFTVGAGEATGGAPQEEADRRTAGATAGATAGTTAAATTAAAATFVAAVVGGTGAAVAALPALPPG